MSMKITLEVLLATEVFQTEEASLAEELARSCGGTVYSWITSGKSNWLEKGFRWCNVLALVVLPGQLPKTIDLLDDMPDDE